MTYWFVQLEINDLDDEVKEKLEHKIPSNDILQMIMEGMQRMGNELYENRKEDKEEIIKKMNALERKIGEQIK